VNTRPIADVAAELGLQEQDLVPYGRGVAKVELAALERPATGAGRLILVSAMSPDRSGVGKTTVSVGLGMGLRALGRRAAVCLREPSLGPVFGRKGGGTGGGEAQVDPADTINLQLTGDIGAVQSANNLLAALVDNALYFRTSDLDPEQVTWRRVIDMNDRALRNVVVGLGGRKGGVLRQTGFDITAASEVMAVLSLATSREDLEARLARVVVGRTRAGRFVTAAELGAVNPMSVLLKDALLPNLVQTRSGGPALVHAGPFANLAHGCSSVLATRLALRYADEVVTEAGFGFDLGGEKFLHLKCRQAGLWPRCVVVAVTLKALKAHGGASRRERSAPNPEALRAGFANLDHHLASVRAFGLPAVVAINEFAGDPPQELQLVAEHCAALGVPCAPCSAYASGAEGALELAKLVAETAQGSEAAPRFLYPLEAPYLEKIETVARELYGAKGVHLELSARRELERIVEAGHGDLPVCMAKTPFSLSDDSKALGRPEGFTISVREVRLQAGAGFVVALTGEVQTLPGLPKSPRGRIRLEDGVVRGLLQDD
jgi:formate--tetrahydrofolate ligase